MKIKEIVIEKGKTGVKIKDNGYGVTLLTTQNGYQWSGAAMTPELAEMTIQVLQEYLDKGLGG